MRILLDYRPALRQRTGVGEYVHELVRALLVQPHAPTLTLFSASWRDRLDTTDLASVAVVDRRIPVHWLNYAWHQWEWPTVEDLTGSAFDVVHASHPLRLPSRTAAQVVTVHDLDFLSHPERTSAEIRRDYPTLAPAHIRQADMVVTVSHATAADIERLTGRAQQDIVVAPLGRPEWPRRVGEPSDGVLLFLGTLEPRKNLHALLEAYAALRARRRVAGHTTPRLVLAGGDGSDGPALRGRAGQPDLAGAVDLPGYVSPDARRALYERALIVLLPSLHEGFGLPALEAMTLGVPVVASRRGALPEVLGDAGAFCDPQSVDDISRTIEQVLDDGGRRAAMVEKGWQRAGDYSWAHTASRTIEAWRMAVEHRRGRR